MTARRASDLRLRWLDAGTIAAMLAFRLRDWLPRTSDSSRRDYSGVTPGAFGRRLLAFTPNICQTEVWLTLRPCDDHERAWRWPSSATRHLSVRESTRHSDPRSGYTMKYYRWKRTRDDEAVLGRRARARSPRSG